MQSQEVNNLTQINIYTEKAVDDSCVSFYHYTHARLIYTCVWWSLYTYKQIYQELKCPTSWDQWRCNSAVVRAGLSLFLSPIRTRNKVNMSTLGLSDPLHGRQGGIRLWLVCVIFSLSYTSTLYYFNGALVSRAVFTLTVIRHFFHHKTLSFLIPFGIKFNCWPNHQMRKFSILDQWFR